MIGLFIGIKRCRKEITTELVLENPCQWGEKSISTAGSEGQPQGLQKRNKWQRTRHDYTLSVIQSDSKVTLYGMNNHVTLQIFNRIMTKAFEKLTSDCI